MALSRSITVGGEPNQALSLLVGLVLTTNAAERERPGNRLERLNADHGPRSKLGCDPGS
jgi:hypothetical protein